MFKKSLEELEEYLKIMRKHNIVKSKKGKGSYVRKKKNKKEEDADLDCGKDMKCYLFYSMLSKYIFTSDSDNSF